MLINNEVKRCGLHKENGVIRYGVLDSHNIENELKFEDANTQVSQQPSAQLEGQSYGMLPVVSGGMQFAPQYVDQWYKAGFRTLEHSTNKATDREYHREIKNMDLEFREKQWEQEDNRDQRRLENSLARCEVAEIDVNGEIHIKTENLTIESSPRRGTNFRCVDTKIYVNAANLHEKIMRLFLKPSMDTSDMEATEVFLDLRKCGKGGYIDKKLEAVGAVIFAKSEAKRKEYARMIVAIIVRECTQTITAPKNRGWYRVNDELKFYDSDYTWKAVVEYAK